MMRRPPDPPARQRGVALITAVLIVALATMLAVNVAFKGALDQRRSLGRRDLRRPRAACSPAVGIATAGGGRVARSDQADRGMAGTAGLSSTAAR